MGKELRGRRMTEKGVEEESEMEERWGSNALIS